VPGSRLARVCLSLRNFQTQAGWSNICGVPLDMASSEQKLKFIMSKPKIIAYLKPSCGWSQGVRAVLRKYDLPFEDRDIINDPLQRQEMIEKSGQMLSPCVEINGKMLADISGEEVEAWMLANNVVTQNDRTPDAPINQPCAHEMPQSAPLNFAIRR
jgi:glutaredoxin